jgi:hypothetical protein
MALKVTLFGGTGQGKTTYTLALLYMMAAGIEGFRIEAKDADTTTKYLNPWRDFVMGKRWPAPTMGRREDHFFLTFNGEYVTDFEWVDYQGGAINVPSDESDEAAQLHADIQGSNAVIIVADAHVIATREQIEAEILTSSAYIFNLLNNYKFRGAGSETGITISLVLTKADIVPDEFKANDYEKLLENARIVFRGLTQFVEGLRLPNSKIPAWQYPAAITPVSIVGEGAVEMVDPGTGYDLATVELKKSPLPMNIHYPFLYAMGNEMDRLAMTIEEEEAQLEERLTQLNRNVLNRLLRGRTIRELHEERQGTARRLQELEDKIRPMTAIAHEKMKALVP